MKTIKTKTTLFAFALTALGVAAASVPAQFNTTRPGGSGTTAPPPRLNVNRSGAKVVSIGDRYLGGGLTVGGRFWANKYSTGNDVGGSLDVDAYGMLLLQSAQIVDLSTGGGSSKFGSTLRGNAYFTLRVGGYTILNSSYSFVTGTRRFRPLRRLANVFASPPAVGIDVGIGTVTVSGNIGADVNMTTDTSLSSGGYTEVLAKGYFGATASASASFRILPGLGTGLGGSVKLSGEIMKNTVNTNVAVDARAASVVLNGGISYVLEPINLSLEACGHYLAGSRCETLSVFSAPRVSIPNVLLL